jgi:hypothetical protein
MKYNRDVVEAMAKAHRECWRDREGVRQDTLDWDEICGAEFLDSIAYIEASLDALVKARPEIAWYVAETNITN